MVLDTNVILAAFASHGLCDALMTVCLEHHHLICSEHILAELQRHLVGKLKLTEDQVGEIISFLEEHTEVVDPQMVESGACPDPDDLPVLGTALAGGADLLVSGDRDLLDLGAHAGIPIVSPRECYARLRTERAPNL